jgi:hypothetical protein
MGHRHHKAKPTPKGKEDPQVTLKKLLKFKVKGYRKKLILLRQQKIYKDTYLKKFVQS